MSYVLCPSCGTRNRHSFKPGLACSSCGRTLPTIVPRAWVYTLRTAVPPLLLLLLAGVVLFASPHLREYRQYVTFTGR